MRVIKPTLAESEPDATFLPGRLAWPDRLIIMTLFYYFLSYPFIIRNLLGKIYPLILFALFGLTVLVCALSRVKVKKLRLTRKGRLLGAAILLYALYFSVLILVSILHSATPIIAISAIYKIRELLFVLIVVFVLSDRGIYVSLRIYVEVFFWCSILGLLLIFLNFEGLLHPISQVMLSNLPGHAGAYRQFYGIGFIWPNTWIGSAFGLERLQSFADEAATFAFAVLPAILLAIHWRMKWRALIMCIAFVMTFSVGAILILLLLSLIWLVEHFVRVRGLRKQLMILSLGGVIILAWSYIPATAPSQVASYLSAKYTYEGGTSTSIGQRLAGLKIALDAVRDHPFGFGVNSVGLSLKLGKASLAVGWLTPLVEAGVLGWALYLAAFGLLIVHVLRTAMTSAGIRRIAAIVILVNGYAAFQRAAIDANVWQLFWLVVYLRMAGMNRQYLSNTFSAVKRTALGYRGQGKINEGGAVS